MRALKGVTGLSLEERGAYFTVLELMYARGGSLPQDDTFLANWLGVSTRLWRGLRDRLIAKGRLSITPDGRLFDETVREVLGTRFDHEPPTNRPRTTHEPHTGTNEISDLFSPIREEEKRESANADLESAPARKPSRRRCPEGWEPTEEDLGVGRALGLSADQTALALAAMRDHEFKTPRSDWSAVFRNWLRKENTHAPRSNGPGADRRLGERAHSLDRMRLGAMAALDRRRQRE